MVETATLPSFTADGELQVKQTWRGAGAEHVRIMYQHVPREQIWKSVHGAIEQRYPGAKSVGEPSVVDDKGSNVVTVSATYSVPKMAIEQSGNWFVRYSPSNLKGALAPPPPASRISPMLAPVVSLPRRLHLRDQAARIGQRHC